MDVCERTFAPTSGPAAAALGRLVLLQPPRLLGRDLFRLVFVLCGVGGWGRGRGGVSPPLPCERPVETGRPRDDVMHACMQGRGSAASSSCYCC